MRRIIKRIEDPLAHDGIVSHYIVFGVSIGMSLGISFGIVFGVASNNIGVGMTIGMSIGMCIGVAIGYAIGENEKKKSPPQPNPKKRRPFLDN